MSRQHQAFALCPGCFDRLPLTATSCHRCGWEAESVLAVRLPKRHRASKRLNGSRLKGER